VKPTIVLQILFSAKKKWWDYPWIPENVDSTLVNNRTQLPDLSATLTSLVFCPIGLEWIF
jgi:hypothetical protein